MNITGDLPARSQPRTHRFIAGLRPLLGAAVGMSLTAGLLFFAPLSAQAAPSDAPSTPQTPDSSASDLVSPAPDSSAAEESVAGNPPEQEPRPAKNSGKADAAKPNPSAGDAAKPEAGAEAKKPAKKEDKPKKRDEIEAAALNIPVPKPVVEIPEAIDSLASYQGQGICSPAAKPGTAKFSALIRETYGSLATSIWIPRDCSVGGRSEHKEGRALDWMINRRDKEQRQTAEAFIDWLLATDENGNEFAMARRLGVMYIGWDDRIWESYRQGWSELKGCFSTPETGYDTYCHRDHIHISLSWDGAAGQTSFWGGNPTPAPFCDRWATASATPQPVGNGLDYIAITPKRVLDTRSGVGTPDGSACRMTQSSGGGAGAPLALDVDSLPKSPDGAVRAVVVRVATLGSNSPAQLRARTGSGEVLAPIAVNKKTEATTIVPVGSDGTIAFTTDSGSTHVLVDVIGYLVKPAAAVGGGGRLTATNPSSVYNSLEDVGPLAPGERRIVTLDQPLAASGTAVAAVAAISVSNGQNSGRLIVRSDREKRTPATPVIKYRRNDAVTQTVITPLGDKRTLTLINKGKGTVEVDIRLQAQAVVDPLEGHLLVPVTPTEINGATTSLRRKLREAQRSSAVVLQVDARTSGAAAGVTFWSGSQPTTPSVQVGRKSAQSSLVVVPLATGGQIKRTLTGGSVDVTARIVAYLR